MGGGSLLKYALRLFLAADLLLIAGQTALAHFKLLEPVPCLIENDLGDPQKAGPCGGTNTDWASPATS